MSEAPRYVTRILACFAAAVLSRHLENDVQRGLFGFCDIISDSTFVYPLDVGSGWAEWDFWCG